LAGRHGQRSAKRPRHAAIVLVRSNVMIWSAAVYCAQVEQGALIVSLRCTFV
jgi:hypothetical protein